jgi:hypothetical protein
MKAKFEAQPEVHRIMVGLQAASEGEQAISDCIRQTALDDYYRTSNKQPHEAVSIRIKKTMDYSYDDARKWAQEHLPEAIVLDRRLFESHAQAVAKTQPVPFVNYHSDAQATISTNLSKYFQE